jgi:hypothetical protein
MGRGAVRTSVTLLVQDIGNTFDLEEPTKASWLYRGFTFEVKDSARDARIAFP